VTLTTERANPLCQRNPGWGGCSTARRPVAAVNKLFLRRPVFVKRFTHEMTLREVPAQACWLPQFPLLSATVGWVIAHKVRILLIRCSVIRNCSLIRGTYNNCRIPAIMSNRTPLTWGVPVREQYCLAGFPDDREQRACRGYIREWMS
jgi:hypothetical protein